MSRKIDCFSCHVDLGEIRDATLRKNTAHFCNVCATQNNQMRTQIQLLIAQISTKKSDPDLGLFKDIFGGKGGSGFFK